MAEERTHVDGIGDPYEAIDMHDGSPVVHRDKLVSRVMTGLLLAPALLTLVLAVVVPVMNASSDKPVPPEALPIVVGGMALLGLLLAVMAIAFGVLRTIVTERALHVRFALWGPTLELSSIRSARVITYPLLRYGGWGIRHGLDGTWAYVGPGARDVVEIEYADERGAMRKVVVGPENPAALVAALDRARGRGGARIAETTASHDERAIAAEAEILAEDDGSARAEPRKARP